MMTNDQSRSQRLPLPERLAPLMVPLIMLAGVGLYVFDAIHLSSAALLFPGILIAVTVAALLFGGAMFFLRRAGKAAAVPTAILDAEGEDMELGPTFALKPWLLVAIALLLTVLFEFLGAMVALFALVLLAQIALGSRSILLAMAIAAGVALPVYALLKYVLYVRFPVGVLGLG